MTEAEERRALVLNRVLAGQWSRGEAAIALGLSQRQVRRVLAAYEAGGPAALLHGNRGRRPAHALAADVPARVAELARTTYAGFNHQHLTEQLAETEGIALGRTTVRRILAAAGLRSPRTRRPPKHRQRRERMAQAGMLVQADGSRHKWLGPDRPYLTLIAGIDDATGSVPWALFRQQEDAAGYMLWLRRVVETVGVPRALYVDRHGIFRRGAHAPLTLEEELAGGPLPTQFGRVLQELGIAVVHALSPQAKGRIERLFGTFQDRLASELRLAGVGTPEEADAFLPGFLARFNRRFAVPAVQPGSAYQSPPSGVVAERVFCFKYTRTVAADNTVRFASHTLQLLPDPRRASYARAQVELHERLDGSVAVYHQGRCLATRDAPASAPTLRARHNTPPPRPVAPVLPAAALVAAAQAPRPRIPAPDHPWRRPFKQQHAAASEDRQPVLPLAADPAHTSYPNDHRTKSPAT